MSKITLENWENARGEKPRRPRGPKPVARGQLLKSTAWLDGDLTWHDGALGWKTGAQIVVPDETQIERAGRVLDKLEARDIERQAVSLRRQKWRLARKLGTLQTRDLDKLCAASRRRNPAALARLAPLLVLESLGIELPQSPARALFGAWPHSQSALEAVASNEEWPSEARELAAFITGAAEPCALATLPKFLRGVAALGARFETEVSAFGWPQLLLKMGCENEKLTRQIVGMSASRAPFAPDARALKRLVEAHGLTATWQVATQLCSVEIGWPELPAYLGLASPAEEKMARETALLWRRARREWQSEMGRILARLALEAPAAIEPFVQLASDLRATATQVAERSRWSHKKRRFLAPDCVETAAFVALVTAEMPALLTKLAQLALQTPHVADCLYLWREVAKKCRDESPVAQTCRRGVTLSAQNWTSKYKCRLEVETQTLARLARLTGADFARWAWQQGRHRELANSSQYRNGQRRPEAPVIASWGQLLKEFPTLSGVALWEWDRLHRSIGPGARGVVAALIDATRVESPTARALIIEGLFWSVPDDSGSPVLWGHLSAMVRASAAILGECGDNIEGATDAVLELGRLCQRLDVEPALRAPLARSFATIYRAHLKAKEWHGDPDLAAKIALQLGHLSASDATLIGNFERNLRHTFEALFADRDSSKEIARALDLTGVRPRLTRALCYGLEVAPARTLSAMEHLVALGKAHQLDALQVLEMPAPELDAQWQETAQISPAIAQLARELASWQTLAGAEAEPPSGALKILNWPRKWAREIEALESKVAANPKLSERLDNLRARLANEPKWRAQQIAELMQLLENATKRAAFAALERVIEGAFRARLEALCGELPAEFAFDDDWFNALLLGSDVEHNRKWARQLLRHEVASIGFAGVGLAGTRDWRQQLPGNARFLSNLSERGVDVPFYLSEFGRARGELWLWIENAPLGILQMGNRFNTCLSRGGCNSFAGVANAIELNKRVVYARDASGHIVARQLWAVSAEFALIGFDVYSTYSEQERQGLEAHFANHAREFARSCGLELADEGEVENLVAPEWYDDGVRAWEAESRGRASGA